jgi:uncharacterized protein (TIGR02118 family)
MLKVILCIQRRPGMTRAEFHAYWKDVHANVVKEVAAALGMRRNVHNRTMTTPLDAAIRQSRDASQEDFDGVAESWFDSLDALIAATSTEAGKRAAKRLAEDEARFIDFSRSRVFFVEEAVVI